MKRLIPLIALFCLTGALPVDAEIYRCTAADGVTSYSDTPCGEEKTEFKKHKPAARTGNATGNSKRERLLRAFEAERKQAQQQASEEKATQQERTRKCALARNELDLLNRTSRVFSVDEQGNREYQSDEERAAMKARVEGYVEYWCDE